MSEPQKCEEIDGETCYVPVSSYLVEVRNHPTNLMFNYPLATQG